MTLVLPKELEELGAVELAGPVGICFVELRGQIGPDVELHCGRSRYRRW